MRVALRRFFSFSFWRNEFSILRAGEAFFAVAGLLWLGIEAISFFAPQASHVLREKWGVFLLVAFGYALLRSRPLTRIACKIEDRDVCIELRVVDIMNLGGRYALVIPFNTAFDPTLSSLRTEKSVAGLVLKRLYSGHAEQLDADLRRALAHADAEASRPDERPTYPIGTVATTEIQTQRCHFLAMSEVGDNGRAVGSFEGVREALPRLWNYLSTHSDKEWVTIPVLGTGKLRLTVQREEVIREIVRSFIAATSERVFCDRLCIAIHPPDVREYKMDVPRLQRFLQMQCEFASFDRGSDPVGKGVGKSTSEESA